MKRVIKIWLVTAVMGMVGSGTAMALDGSGTEQDPWRIKSLADFNDFAANANYWDDYTRLETDVNLSGRIYNTAVIAPSFPTAFTGVFDGNEHKIMNLTIDDGGAGKDYLGLFGHISGGDIRNLGLEGGSVRGNDNVGGLVGFNVGPISNCYSTGDVSGVDYVGGLVGFDFIGSSISNCYSTGDVDGAEVVGGLVGFTFEDNILQCYSTGDVSGVRCVGGLVGTTNNNNILQCYSTGDVSGVENVGGLVGRNDFYARIKYSYSTGNVSGYDWVGGLVGINQGSVWKCFWDRQTSGTNQSDGGIGKTTAEMQTKSTFTNYGWDFVGESDNGIEDIWFIPQQDYPHLWWEGMGVSMKLTPRMLNCRSYGNWVKAHITLPEGFTIADVDSNRPAVLHSFGFESAPLYVFVNENERVQIEAAFEREAVCSLAGDWPETFTVAGFLADGNIFLGSSNVRVITPGMKEIQELAYYWLSTDCNTGDGCNGMDLNGDSIVNFVDFALLQRSSIEFISQ